MLKYRIKMDLREVGWGGMEWIDLARDRDQWRALVNTDLAILVGVCGLLLMAGTVRCVVLMTDPFMTRLVAISGQGHACVVYNDRSVIRRMILESDPTLVREVKPADLTAVAKACRKESVSHRQGQRGFIYPDTKWCGPGNVALDYDDLGAYTEEDKCCRDHDHCPDQLEPGQCLYGLCNNSPFTRLVFVLPSSLLYGADIVPPDYLDVEVLYIVQALRMAAVLFSLKSFIQLFVAEWSHCDCDARFRRCLQSLNTDTSNTLGALFFNVAQVTCFTESRPCPQLIENCLLKEVIEGKIEGRIEVTRRRGRRRKKMLDDLGDRRGYCHLKEKALDRIKWRNCFGRDCGPVV
ncbi:Phospholipase A2 isozymes PA3A/PA3B/PA5 [Cryptotermes secundus]|uniref:phospholipase A2 n=1 Tax=Cryptotermes secundus TaxID=105785 RepID=A0A2J7Q6V0_9NEOP|nr:Phospholipase A2 isozymes PA3A/PA3B/PA5 [Cryptotermes secundus]